ncbi:MAG: thiolase family protein [Proteobacteria bacterium]|nr:thiolase family protein [Pseudomonadota bacterium]MBU1695558.1 thiolase family protein [Pseudomonadota bacterium]
MTDVAVVGVGMIPFGKHPQKTLVDMGSEAAYLAIKDAGLSPRQMEIGFFANAFAGRVFGDFTIGQNVFWKIGINRIPVVNVENACTSGSSAFFLAYNAVAAGQVEIAIAVGAEKMRVPEMGLLNSGQNEVDTQLGLVAPASFAMRAMRYIYEYDAKPEQLAQVSVKNRRHSSLNNLSGFRDLVSIEDVLAAPMIVDPLTRLMCCPNADGAAAVVLVSPAIARRLGRSVGVNTALLFSGSYENPQDQICWETDYRACRTAYERAGIGPEDLDVVECHDAFTICEILHYEAMGLCPIGEGAQFAADGETEIGGRIPVNTSGGLIGRGHPPGATGIAQVCEIVTQLRQEAGQRQVNGAKTGLAHCMGGDKEGDTKSCTIAIFSV